MQLELESKRSQVLAMKNQKHFKLNQGIHHIHVILLHMIQRVYDIHI